MRRHGAPTPMADKAGRRLWRRAPVVAVLAAVAALIAAMFTAQPASAQTPAAASAAQPLDTPGNPYQRGPDPTLAMIESSRGPFATASTSVPPGNGFNGGMVYYPTDTAAPTSSFSGVPAGMFFSDRS